MIKSLFYTIYLDFYNGNKSGWMYTQVLPYILDILQFAQSLHDKQDNNRDC